MTDLTITYAPRPGGVPLHRNYRLPGTVDPRHHVAFLENVWAASHLQQSSKPPLDWLWKRLSPLPNPERGIQPGDHVRLDGCDYWATERGWTAADPAAPPKQQPQATASEAGGTWQTAEELARVHRSGSFRPDYPTFGAYLKQLGLSHSRAYQLLHYADLVAAIQQRCPDSTPQQLLTEAQARDIWPHRDAFLDTLERRLESATTTGQRHNAIQDSIEDFRHPDPLLDAARHLGQSSPGPIR